MVMSRQPIRQNLATPGSRNRSKILTRRGQVEEQDIPIQTKATEQEVVKPRNLLSGRSTIRREQPIETITAGEMFRAGPRGPEDIITQPAPKRRKKLPETIGTTRVSEKDDVFKLVGTGAPGQAKTPARKRKGGFGTRRSKDFNILNFEGIENIFSSAGQLASFFASPEFRARQRKAIGARIRSKEKRADLKSIDNSIKAISAALGEVELSGDTALKTTLSNQLSEALRQRQGLLSGGRATGEFNTPELFAARLKGTGQFNNEEILSITNRLFTEQGT